MRGGAAVSASLGLIFPARSVDEMFKVVQRLLSIFHASHVQTSKLNKGLKKIKIKHH